MAVKVREHAGGVRCEAINFVGREPYSNLDNCYLLDLRLVLSLTVISNPQPKQGLQNVKRT